MTVQIKNCSSTKVFGLYVRWQSKQFHQSSFHSKIIIKCGDRHTDRISNHSTLLCPCTYLSEFPGFLRYVNSWKGVHSPLYWVTEYSRYFVEPFIDHVGPQLEGTQNSVSLLFIENKQTVHIRVRNKHQILTITVSIIIPH